MSFEVRARGCDTTRVRFWVKHIKRIECLVVGKKKTVEKRGENKLPPVSGLSIS